MSVILQKDLFFPTEVTTFFTNLTLAQLATKNTSLLNVEIIFYTRYPMEPNLLIY